MNICFVPCYIWESFLVFLGKDEISLYFRVMMEKNRFSEKVN